jgi:lipid II:glycine glycyltransferase (peptidoglycan interpeptide bridge formation enzyme)
MHQKTRYNIRVAQKHDVEIVEDNSEEGFETYWKLTEETTKRQNFYAHTKTYHKLQWETLNSKKQTDNALTSHLFFAKYKGEILAAWVLFIFQDTLYYPYGSSSSMHREVMASNLIMWEAIKFGKKRGLKKFDMWGAMSDTPDTKDPWYGFHRFKQGYGARHVQFIGSYDVVINPVLYELYKLADKVRWAMLKIRK